MPSSFDIAITSDSIEEQRALAKKNRIESTQEAEPAVDSDAIGQKKAAQPKHERLRSQLLGEMAEGRLRSGDMLPTELQLAEMLRISRTTVRQALGDLEREGLVHRIPGKGTIVADRPSEQVSSAVAAFALVVNELSTGYYPALLAEFERATKRIERPMVVCSSNNDVGQQANHLMQLISNRVAGIALNPCGAVPTPAHQVDVVQQAGIPLVLLHRAIPRVQAPVLRVPEYELGYRAAHLMVEAGHRRVAFLAGSFAQAPSLFENGFRQSLGEAGIDLPAELVDYAMPFKTFTSAEDVRLFETYVKDALSRMLALADPPTAIFTTFDSLAEVAYVVAAKLGLHVPGDLSIVSYGGVRRDRAVIGRLTAVTIDEAEEARRAVQLLVEMCEGRRPIRNTEAIASTIGVSRGETLAAPGDRGEVY